VGAALEYLVVAYDCPDANPDDVVDELGHAKDSISSGLRWFFCGGLAVAVACMGTSLPSIPRTNSIGVISLTHVHLDSRYLNLRKRYRLAFRGAVCLIILLLPLAGDKLNSLQLIGLVTALLWLVIGVETWGNAQKCHVWIGEKKKREYICKYNIRCVQGEEKEPEEEDGKEDDTDLLFSV